MFSLQKWDETYEKWKPWFEMCGFDSFELDLGNCSIELMERIGQTCKQYITEKKEKDSSGK